jgi:DNA-binding MarR family transcriptional regulator
VDRHETLEALFDEVRLSWHRVVQVTETLHADERVTLGMRAVLEFLQRSGAATVPHIARSRHVSRQHIQSLVNPLAEEGLLELRDNPAHRRSPLVTLTTRGERLIRRLRQKEHRAFEAMEIEVSERQLETATRTLRSLRLSLKEEA